MANSHRSSTGATRARQGRLGRHMLWVLLVGVALAALALFGAWTWKSGDLASANSNNGGPSSANAKAFNAPEPAPIATAPPAKPAANP